MDDTRILITNEYYPKGLNDVQVQKHYKKYQKEILLEVQRRKVALVICPDTNNLVWLRNIKNKPIYLKNRRDFQNIIHERVLSIFPEIQQYEKKLVVDIDCTNINNAKKVAKLLYNIFTKSGYITDVKIFFTGQTSFHLHLFLPNKTNIERGKELVDGLIRRDAFAPKLMTINQRRPKDEFPNIDFSTFKERSIYICPYSLSKFGLIAGEVKINEIDSFNIQHYKVK